MFKVPESALKKTEKEHADGITSVDLLEFFLSQNIRFGEATLRKWVQIGLLPRSIRVGQKGKHQGSKGKYPVRVIRQVLRIKELMATDLTIEEIQRQFLFVRGDIEALEQTLGKIFATLDHVVSEREGKVTTMRSVGADLVKAQGLANDLMERLEKIESRLIADVESKGAEVAAS